MDNSSEAKELYEKLLAESKALDWYYRYSDDLSVYRRGEAAHKAFIESWRKLRWLDPVLASEVNDVVPPGVDLYKGLGM